MAGQLEVTVHSTDQKLGYTGALRSLPPVAIDYIPPLGDGQGYLPLELVLMSLAACSGGTVALTLRKMGNKISRVTVNAQGQRRDEHPTSFQRISLEFILTAEDLEDSDVQKAIKLSEDSVCPVWAMLKNSVEIVPRYRIDNSR